MWRLKQVRNIEREKTVLANDLNYTITTPYFDHASWTFPRYAAFDFGAYFGFSHSNTFFFGRNETEIRIFRVIGFRISFLAGRTIFYIFHVTLYIAVFGIVDRKFNVEKMIAIKMAHLIFLLCISCTLPVATTSVLRARFISFGIIISAETHIRNDLSNSWTKFCRIRGGRIKKFAHYRFHITGFSVRICIKKIWVDDSIASRLLVSLKKHYSFGINILDYCVFDPC